MASLSSNLAPQPILPTIIGSRIEFRGFSISRTLPQSPILGTQQQFLNLRFSKPNNQMAMEQNAQETVPQTSFIKENEGSLDKWKSSSEPVVESEHSPSAGFDCNICLDEVQDPVVTLCGHLYCWPCIYKWIHHQTASSKPPAHHHHHSPQCPVCKTEISQKTVIPLYGRGQATTPSLDEKGVVIPRRPASPTRQVNHQQQAVAASHVPIPAVGGMVTTNMINPTSPTIRVFGEMVYERIFGGEDSHATTLFAHPNSYNLAGISTRRARRQAMQADMSLGRIWFFLFCFVMLCLVLF